MLAFALSLHMYVQLALCNVSFAVSHSILVLHVFSHIQVYLYEYEYLYDFYKHLLNAFFFSLFFFLKKPERFSAAGWQYNRMIYVYSPSSCISYINIFFYYYYFLLYDVMYEL